MRDSKNSGSGPLLDTKKHVDTMLVRKLKGRRLPTLRQLRYIGHVLSKADKIVLGVAGALFCFSLGFILWDVSRTHLTSVPANGGEYSEAIISSPRFLNPVLSPLNDADADVVKLIFSGLLRRDANQKLINDLAESYEVGEDHKTYTFKLKEGLTWHDGKPLTADDVVFTYKLVSDPTVKSPLYGQFSSVNIEKVDDRTVLFSLAAPFAPFPESLTLGLLPSHLWSNIPTSAIPFAEYNLKKPVGAGPYRIDQYRMDKKGSVVEYTLVRNKKYSPQPRIDKITLKFFSTTEEALDAVNGNVVQGMSYVPSELRQNFLTKKSRLVGFNAPEYRAVFFNTQSTGSLSELAVRLALIEATDKLGLIRETAKNDATIINGPILPGFLGYYPGLQTYYEDLDAAKASLENAGWKLAEGAAVRSKSFTKKEGKKTVEEVRDLTFTLTTIDRQDLLKQAELLKTQWERLGLKVTIQAVNADDFFASVIRPRAYEALLYDEILGADPDPYAFWHSSQAQDTGANLSRYANKEVDKILEEARVINEPEARAKDYRDFQDLLIKDVPAIFLMSPKYVAAIGADVKGLDTERIIQPADRFSNIVNWYIKTRSSWK